MKKIILVTSMLLAYSILNITSAQNSSQDTLDANLVSLTNNQINQNFKALQYVNVNAGTNLCDFVESWKLGSNLFTTGTILSLMSIPMYNIDTRLSIIVSVSGLSFAVIGYIIQIRSYNHIKKAGFTMTGSAVKFTF